MVQAARTSNVSSFIMNTLLSHQSQLLTKAEVLDPNTFIFLVTDYHEDWVRGAVGDDAVNVAKQDGRMNLIHSDQEEIPDPFFGDQDNYNEVCHILLEETTKSLKTVLVQRGFLSPEK